ncbi:MAG: HAMP domain-containing protein [Lachnospiraceae bacterium]|nr:HAMP domain-containing protein [Lachnospiraceae bacterium]
MKLKHSIQRKWTAIIVSMIAVALLACVIINNTFLENFYLKDKQANIEKAYYALEECLLGGLGSEEVLVKLGEMSDRYVIDYLVVDSQGREMYSNSREYDRLVDVLLGHIIGFRDDNMEILKETDNYTVLINKDNRFNTNYFEIWGNLQKGNYYVLLRSPIETIKDSVAISNRFFAYVGIAVIVISSIVMWFITRRFTKPVLELAALSEQMSNLDFNAKYIRNDNDEIGVLGNSMNRLSERLEKTISELKAANNELQRDIEQKIQIDEMRKEFLANVSHELKTPIALIQGYAEGLHESINDDPESRDFYCEVIIDEAEKMSNMVKRMLDLNQIEFGQEQLQIERFDIVMLIKSVINATDIKIKQKEATVIFDMDEPVYVWADEYQIEEVVTNYISNALNHIDFEKKITVTVEKLQDESLVRVYVHNTGKNIPEEDIDKLWIKFYKVDKARTREYGGNGIGLSIVKAVMDAHNRQCGVFNTEDGVTFWFEADCKN